MSNAPFHLATHPARGAIISSLASAWQIIRSNINRKLSQRDAGRVRSHLTDALRYFHEGQQTATPYQRQSREARAEMRARVFTAYGGAGACCGESHFDALTIDHIRPLKGKRRRHRIYQHLLALGCPRDGNFQVLCLNCNMLKGTLAECPHLTERREQSAAA